MYTVNVKDGSSIRKCFVLLLISYQSVWSSTQLLKGKRDKMLTESRRWKVVIFGTFTSFRSDEIVKNK